METTNRGNRLHIGIIGKRNSGKSSLINALTGQNAAIVSSAPGTTADPVYKNMEIRGVGACVLIDTAGYDDEGELGALRVAETEKAIEKADVVLLVFCGALEEVDQMWVKKCMEKGLPVLPVRNCADLGRAGTEEAEALCGRKVILTSTKTGEGIQNVRAALSEFAPEVRSITERVCKSGDHVVLVMPQDVAAPKGRLILPQVQTIRELLDRGCIVTCLTPETMESALSGFSRPPALVITDSQAFRTVHEKTPKGVPLTSFSVLFADVKGDITTFLQGAETIDTLKESDRVLIAEACTHAPATEDIGRVKIPAMLRKKVGENLTVDIVAGDDFPKDLSSYQLIIHCGACMFNRRHVLARIAAAASQNVPISNYGMVMAKLGGILDTVLVPGRDTK